ncbi:pdfr-1 (predicted) [Pycnogonum litorale]
MDVVPDHCRSKYSAETQHFINSGDTFCDVWYDGYLCWSPTAAADVAYENCPSLPGIDTRRYATRICGEKGIWLSEDRSQKKYFGWTNFSDCYTEEHRNLLETEDYEDKLKIANITRYMEMVGYSLSFILISFALFIFFFYRSLKNHRTHIHKNLMLAMLIQVIIRLTIYIEIASKSNYENNKGINKIPNLCKSVYVLLEYVRTAMFMWFFVEGFYLHQAVAVNSISFRPNYYVYYILGWGLPVPITVSWAAVTATFMAHVPCWSLYSLKPYFWIVEGPRLSVLFINLVFLLNTLRILVSKLRSSSSRKSNQIMKAMKAAFVLLPLLGISNGLLMMESPFKRTVIEFGFWAFSSHFLSSFQGVFISLLYCFLNKEVKSAVVKHWEQIKWSHFGWERNRSLSASAGRRTSVVNLSTENVRPCSSINCKNWKLCPRQHFEDIPLGEVTAI